jgi:glycosyltransferase involved in cell wall biosynthesis
MACGTPVIAFHTASVPEVIEPGRSGFIVRSIDEAVEAVSRLSELDRAVVRACFDRRFSSERMARDYLDIYRALPGVLAPTTPVQLLRGNSALHAAV